MARKGGKDRGLFQRKGSTAWWIRWSCPYGHEHFEKIGPKSLVREVYHRRKVAVKTEGFCLTQARDRQRREQPVLFRDVARRYLTWSQEQWQKLSKALDAPELLHDPRFAEAPSRAAHLHEMRQVVQNRLRTLTRAEAVARLEDADVPCAPVRTVAEVVADEHLCQRGTLLPVRHGALPDPVKGVAASFPVVFSGGALRPLAGAPTLGMHNAAIYDPLLGLHPEDIQRLHDQGEECFLKALLGHGSVSRATNGLEWR
jgi:hypothetical protein